MFLASISAEKMGIPSTVKTLQTDVFPLPIPPVTPSFKTALIDYSSDFSFY